MSRGPRGGYIGEIPEVLGPQIREGVTRGTSIPHYGKRKSRKIPHGDIAIDYTDRTVRSSFLVLVLIYIIIIYLLVWFIPRNNQKRKIKHSRNDLIVYIILGVIAIAYGHHLYRSERNHHYVLGIMLFTLLLLIVGVIIRNSDIRVEIYRIYVVFALVSIFLLETFWLKYTKSNWLYSFLFLVLLVTSIW